MTDFWDFDRWPAVRPLWDDGTWQEVWTDGTGSERVRHGWADLEYHVDLGCGRLKKGRIGVDHCPDPGVDVVMDLNTLGVKRLPAGAPPVGSRGLPFPTSSIQSIVTHHCLEHIGTGFMDLMDDVYRVLEPDGVLYAITPLFPARNAVDDPTHCRYITEDTWRSFCGTPGDTPQNCWLASFSTPYTRCRFEMVEQHADPLKPPGERWGADDVREIRVVLRANK